MAQRQLGLVYFSLPSLPGDRPLLRQQMGAFLGVKWTNLPAVRREKATHLTCLLSFTLPIRVMTPLTVPALWSGASRVPSLRTNWARSGRVVPKHPVRAGRSLLPLSPTVASVAEGEPLTSPFPNAGLRPIINRLLVVSYILNLELQYLTELVPSKVVTSPRVEFLAP